MLLSTRSDRPVARASVEVDGTAIPLRVDGGRALSGTFTVKKTGHYAFAFQDARGREKARGPEVPITAEPDQPPKVTLQLPAAELEVDSDQEVTLKYEATDDYGLTQLHLVYRVDGKDEVRAPLSHDEGTQDRRPVALGAEATPAGAGRKGRLLRGGHGQQRRARPSEGAFLAPSCSKSTVPASTAAPRS